MSKWIDLGEWDRKTGSVGLSKARRERLREFADSVGEGLTKAEALYALIDRALPIAPAPSPVANPQADAFREVAERSASALERVAATLTPLERLISADEGDEPAPSARPNLGPRAWIDGALAQLAVRPQSQFALGLQWQSCARRPGEPANLVFSVDRLRLDQREIDASAANLPSLALRLRDAGASSDISLATLLGPLALVCRPLDGGWSCELRSIDPKLSPLLAFRC
ncbi:MAG: hypothetical protein H0T53_14730 [Herpetosiphonaceae bacterium]|nr:hypothetical protein [Herpetosiphonaceae bacterium]